MDYLVVDAVEHMTNGSQGGLWFRAFPGGAMVLTSLLDVRVPTEFHFATDPAGIHISAQYFLSGEAVIEMGDGTIGYWSQNGRSIVRSDTPGFRLRIEPGQILRHVCVSMYHHALSDILDSYDNPQIAALMATDRQVNLAAPIPSGPGLRNAAQELYEASQRRGIGALKAEGLAKSFLSEALEAYVAEGNGSEATDDPLAWQRDAVRKIKDAIDAAPLAMITPDDLLKRFRVSESMARRVFRAEHGETLAAYARKARFRWAADALREGAAVKQVAYDSGYSYVGNFTRAYRLETGELPSQTRKRAGAR